jgi:hypothetical protein
VPPDLDCGQQQPSEDRQEDDVRDDADEQAAGDACR